MVSLLSNFQCQGSVGAMHFGLFITMNDFIVCTNDNFIHMVSRICKSLTMPESCTLFVCVCPFSGVQCISLIIKGQITIGFILA